MATDERSGARAQSRRRATLADWPQLLHFGPSVFTTILFAIYIFIAARGWPDPVRLLLLLCAQLATQFSISLLNDVWDLALDAQTKPDKPLPSGAIGLAMASRLGWLLAVTPLLLALALGPLVLLFNAIGLAAGLIYDYRLKRTGWSWLPFAAGFGVLPLWAWAGLGRDLPPQLWLALPLIALLVIALHIADTLPDLEDDRAAGLRGFAHRLGFQRALQLCWSALGAGLLVAVGLGLAVRGNEVLLWLMFAVGALLLVCAVLIYSRLGARGLRPMAGLIELASMLVAVLWVAATNL